jgi:hypothetical protein
MRRSISVVAVLGLLWSAAILVAASTAEATIVVGRGMDGVTLGESEAQVMTTLGAPTYKMAEGQGGESSWGYPKTLEGRIGFDRQLQVSGMWTISKHQKTSKGVGPGSSLANTRKAYPAAKCSTGPFGPKSLICVMKSHYQGRAAETAFVFFTRGAPMREVDIGFS